MRVVPVIQARMGSSRLPGKMMLQLDGVETIRRVVRRVQSAETPDEVVVATTEKRRDDLIEQDARDEGATVYRGDSADVLQRTLRAAEVADADVVVRVTGDCPVACPSVIDAVVDALQKSGADYASNKAPRTFPLGLDVEAFTLDSFRTVEAESTEPNEREHVTVYYLEHPEEFAEVNVTSDEVFTNSEFIDRTELELVLDEPTDYRLLDRVFSELNDSQPDVRTVIDHIDERELTSINDGMRRKTRNHSEHNNIK